MQKRNLLSVIASKLIPESVAKRVKRVLLMGSLYFVVAGETHPGDEQLEEANAKLKLSPTKEGLRMSAALSNAIWKKRLPQKTVDEISDKTREGCVGDACDIVVRAVPKWLMYEKETRVMEDIRRVVSSAVGSKMAHHG